jgi:hypothetical protein
VGVLGRFGAVAAATLVVLSGVKADADSPQVPSLLLFAGDDLWHAGAFLNGGFLWSPAGLDHDSFTLKLVLNGGVYTYPSSGLHTDVEGTLGSAAVLPGWRINSNGIILGLYIGPVVQDYRLSPFDPGSLLHGFYSGAQIALDAWYQPSAATMVALDASVASIEAIGSARAAVGWRFDGSAFAGPEVQAFWCIDYQEWRIGAHVTGFPVDGLYWSAATGLAADSFGRLGPYLRLGVYKKY